MAYGSPTEFRIKLIEGIDADTGTLSVGFRTRVNGIWQPPEGFYPAVTGSYKHILDEIPVDPKLHRAILGLTEEHPETRYFYETTDNISNTV